jgi:hypothetical protein
MESWLPAPRLKQPLDVSEVNGYAPLGDSAPQPLARPLAKPPTRPARALQQQLHQAFGAEPAAPETGSWPGVAKVVALVGSSALLWAGIIAVWRAVLG